MPESTPKDIATTPCPTNGLNSYNSSCLNHPQAGASEAV